MVNSLTTLAAVVQDLVASLSDERKSELKTILRNPLYSESWVWYKEVINRYLKGPNAKALMDDIELHYPGAEFCNAISEHPHMHTYEAELILQEAQKALSK